MFDEKEALAPRGPAPGALCLALEEEYLCYIHLAGVTTFSHPCLGSGARGPWAHCRATHFTDCSRAGCPRGSNLPLVTV